MNIIITAGGTAEAIDNVRSITNTGTGKLGSLIADEFSKYDEINKIFYVCPKNAIQPISEKAVIMHVQSVSDLQKAITDIVKMYDINIIVHSMAVSDYRVKSVVNMESIVNSLAEIIDNNTIFQMNEVRSALLQAFDINNLKKTGKISSQINNPVILLEQTPKVISMLKESVPNAAIIGFKLLNNVSEDELLRVAYKLLIDNGCDYVLANDASNIQNEQHKGFLIDRDKKISVFNTKQKIAEGIVTAVLEKE